MRGRSRWWRWLEGLLVAGVVSVLTVVGGARLLRRQAALARAEIFAQPLGEEAPNGDKVYRERYPDRLELLVLGDSIAAGLGAEKRKETLGGRLAKALAKRTKRSVHLRTVAQVGAQTSKVHEQLDGLPEGYRPDLAVLVVGGNDVTHRVPIGRSVADLVEVIDRLQDLGAEVVVGTCPNLGAIRPLRQPLRSVAGRRSGLLARAQRKAAVARGARTVSLGRAVGPIFLADPERMFSLDRFHPSAAGYRRTANAMLPSLLAALGELEQLPKGHYAPRRP